MSTPPPAVRTSAAFLQIFALGTLAIIALGAFILSFRSLVEVWIAIGAGDSTAPVFPIIIDGSILASTISIVYLSSYEKRYMDKIYSWFVLFLFSGASIWLNAIHVTLSSDRKFDITTSSLISAAPSVSLMLTIHLIAILVHRNKKKSGSLHKSLNKEGEVVTGAKKKTDAQILSLVKRHVAKNRPVTNKDMMNWTGASTPQSAAHTVKRLKAEYPEISFVPSESRINNDNELILAE